MRSFQRVGAHVIEPGARYVAVNLPGVPAGDLVDVAEWSAMAVQAEVDRGRIAPVLVPNGHELRKVKS